jgi:hypothetical protein
MLSGVQKIKKKLIIYFMSKCKYAFSNGKVIKIDETDDMIIACFIGTDASSISQIFEKKEHVHEFKDNSLFNNFLSTTEFVKDTHLLVFHSLQNSIDIVSLLKLFKETSVNISKITYFVNNISILHNIPFPFGYYHVQNRLFTNILKQYINEILNEKRIVFICFSEMQVYMQKYFETSTEKDFFKFLKDNKLEVVIWSNQQISPYKPFFIIYEVKT